MTDFITFLLHLFYGFLWLFGIGVIVSWFGYVWELGKNRATKHKKLCDLCFRDIGRWNEEVKRQEAKGFSEEAIQKGVEKTRK